jgi:hypothetical protein
MWQPALSDVQAIRPRLADEFRNVPPKFLAVNEFVFTVEKIG